MAAPAVIGLCCLIATAVLITLDARRQHTATKPPQGES